MKRRLGGIPHAATPLFCKVFGEFVLPARIPPDRLIGDPTPFNKGVFGAGKQFDKFLFIGLFSLLKNYIAPKASPRGEAVAVGDCK